MNKKYLYYAKQECMPISLFAEAVAEHHALLEELKIENFQSKRDAYLRLYTDIFTKNISNYSVNDDPELIDVEKIVEWAYYSQIKLPDEFLVLIDKNNKNLRLRESVLVKQHVQVAALTLWSINIERTQQDIITSNAVNFIASGQDYSDKTLLKWVSEVDPRPHKTGPKKSK